MLLLIDIGNTYGKCAVFADQCKLIAQSSVSLDILKEKFPVLAALQLTNISQIPQGKKALLTLHHILDRAFISLEKQVDNLEVKMIYISSVVKWLDEILLDFLKTRFQLTPTFLRASNHNLELEIDHTEELGADLIAGAIGALDTYKKDCIIIHCGTATTVSLVKVQTEQEIRDSINSSSISSQYQEKIGKFLGGLIIPGVYSSFAGLVSKVPSLPMPWLRYTGNQREYNKEKLYGKNTLDALQKGGYYGFLTMIEGLIAKLVTYFDHKPLVILTGGLINTFHPKDLKIFDILDPILIMRGLYYLAQLEIQERGYR